MENKLDELYIDRLRWLLCNGYKAKLDSKEILLCLYLQFLQENNQDIDFKQLSLLSGLSTNEIDSLIQKLVEQTYLKINIVDNKVNYDLSNLYLGNKDYVAKDTLSLFEEVFSRPFNTSEIQKISDLDRQYSSQAIISALRRADAARKLSVGYVEAILKDE